MERVDSGRRADVICFCFRRGHSSASDDVELEKDDVELEEDSRSASVCRLFLAPAFCKRAAALATRAVSSFSRMMGAVGLRVSAPSADVQAR